MEIRLVSPLVPADPAKSLPAAAKSQIFIWVFGQKYIELMKTFTQKFKQTL